MTPLIVLAGLALKVYKSPMNTSWKTNLGASLEILGVTLMGVGVVPQLGTFGSKTLNVIALIGFILMGVGKALTSLFSANPDAIKAVTDSLQLQATANATSITTGDPSHALIAQAVAAVSKTTPVKTPPPLPPPTPKV